MSLFLAVGAALFAGAVALAFGIINALAPRLFLLEKILGAVAVGIALGGWAAFIFSIALGSVSPLAVAGAAVAVCAAAGVILARQRNRLHANLVASELSEHGGLAAILLVGLAAWLFLFSTHVLEPRADGTYSAGSTWGDLALHLGIINSFVHGPNSQVSLPLELASPVFAGSKLAYPIIPDFTAAALVVSGAGLREAILFPSALIATALLGLVYFLAYRFTQDKSAAVAAVILLVFCGGIGAYYAVGDAVAFGGGLVEFAASLPADYVHATGSGKTFYWLNIVTDILLPQRSALFAFPACVFAFILLWLAGGAEKLAEKRSYLLLAGGTAGILPFLQGHAFIGVAVISSVYFLCSYTPPLRRHAEDWLHFFIPMGLLALPQLAYLSGQAARWGFARFSPLWGGGGIEAPLVFWLENLGLFAVFAFAGILLLNDRQKRFYAPFVALFLTASVVVFQPWEVDNTKLLYLWAVAAACVAGACMQSLSAKAGGFALAVSIILVLASASAGMLAVAREAQLHYLFHSPAQAEVGEWAKQTPADSVFLTSDWHAHPVLTIAGRQLVMGYRGWLWTHGYEYSGREADVKKMLSGAPEAQRLLADYGVDYVAIGPSEINDFGADADYFESGHERVFRNSEYAVFRIDRS